MVINYPDGEVVDLLFDRRLHSYKVGDEVVPSATKVLNIISKPALIPWALKVGVGWLEKNIFHDEDAGRLEVPLMLAEGIADEIEAPVAMIEVHPTHERLEVGVVWLNDARPE